MYQPKKVNREPEIIIACPSSNSLSYDFDEPTLST